MKSFRIAVYPGDGVGQEVTEQAVRVLETVRRSPVGLELELESFPWGWRYFEEHGRVVPEDFLGQLSGFDAIFLGAVGWPAKLPDHVTLEPLIRLRQSFDLYACVRPARLLPGVPCPLAGRGPDDIDLVVVRENSEGEYVSNGGRFKVGQSEEFALQTAVHTRRGIERILEFAFDLARKRRLRLTMATKSNAQRYGYVLWDEVFEEVRSRHGDIESDKQHIDALLMNLVGDPGRFDVIVASNLFGDLLTDLAGLIGGGLGTAPSANIQPERRHPSVFEPVHGSAPDIAGRGVANPVAAILSAAMMLDWLGSPAAAGAVRRAVEEALAAGARTRDLGGSLSCAEMGDRILAWLERALADDENRQVAR